MPAMTMSLPSWGPASLRPSESRSRSLSPTPYFSPLRRAAARGPGFTSRPKARGTFPPSSSQMGR